MANQEQLEILKQGVSVWNAWRKAHPAKRIDLPGADLPGADLPGAKLAGANLAGANLTGANLAGADLNWANLTGADLTGANLAGADLSRATTAEIVLSNSVLYETLLVDLDLSSCKSLGSCIHRGPSIIDIRTLQRSGPLPPVFLRGIGLSDKVIEYLPSLFVQPIQLSSCFISYSAKDEDFVRRLHADLQANGVRCWFAPEDIKIGDRILDTIDAAIRLRDKVLLVLSNWSIKSDWVEVEVMKAFAEERRRGVTVLFPITLDDEVFETDEAWAVMLRDSRHIGDFRGWKDHDAYQKALHRLLRSLQIEAA